VVSTQPHLFAGHLVLGKFYFRIAARSKRFFDCYRCRGQPGRSAVSCRDNIGQRTRNHKQVNKRINRTVVCSDVFRVLGATLCGHVAERRVLAVERWGSSGCTCVTQVSVQQVGGNETKTKMSAKRRTNAFASMTAKEVVTRPLSRSMACFTPQRGTPSPRHIACRPLSRRSRIRFIHKFIS
jgi:hypothetical protein